MKKIAVGAGVAVIGLGILSYPVMGYLVERQIRHQLAIFPKQYGMSLELKNFERRWFSSDAVLHWEWHVPAHLTQNLQGQTITVSPKHFEQDFKVQIFHGPFVFQSRHPFLGIGYAHTSFDWPLPNKTNPAVYTKESTFPKLDLTFAVNFLLQTSWSTDVPQFKLISAENNNQLQWNGLFLSNKISSHLNKINGKVRFNGIDINNFDEHLTINDIDSDYRFKADKSGLYTGRLNFELGQLNFDKQDLSKIRLDTLKIDNHSEIENNLFSSEIEASLKALKINDSTIGPFDIDVKFGRLDPFALKKIHEVLQQQQNASPSFRTRGLWSISTSLPDLLKNGMFVQIKKCHLQLEKGNIDAQLTMSLPADDANLMFNFQRLQKITADSEIKMTSTLVHDWLVDTLQKQLTVQSLSLDNQSQDSQQIADAANARINDKLSSLIKAGVLTEESSNYVMHIKLENGQLMINNLPFDPSWLII